MPAADAPGTRRAYPRALTLDSGTAITLRFMTAADAAAVIAFAKSLPADDLLFLPMDITSASVVAQWVKNLAAGRTVTVIAEAGDEMAGYASLHHHETSWQRHLGEIRIQAGQRYRSQGLGRGLAGEVFALATELGLRKIVAQMTVDQKGAIAHLRAPWLPRRGALVGFRHRPRRPHARSHDHGLRRRRVDRAPELSPATNWRSDYRDAPARAGAPRSARRSAMIRYTLGFHASPTWVPDTSTSAWSSSLMHDRQSTMPSVLV